jgi:hypothetical protein
LQNVSAEWRSACAKAAFSARQRPRLLRPAKFWIIISISGVIAVVVGDEISSAKKENNQQQRHETK